MTAPIGRTLALSENLGTIIWISKDTHWVVVQLENGEGSVFENEESDLEVGEKLLADWTAYGGSE
jgi:hypothetical protein